MIWLICFLVFLAVSSTTLAVFQQRSRTQALLGRLKAYSRKVPTVYEQQTNVPVFERLAKPALERASRLVTSSTPQHVKDSLRKQLQMAGNPGNLQASEFVALKVLITGGIWGLSLLFRVPLISGVALGLIGWMLPNMFLQSKVKQRVQSISSALPDVLDLLTVSVEAGLGFDSAMAKVVEKTKGPLAEEFQRTLQEVRVGKPRRDAMRNLSYRTGVHDLQGFVAAIIQADQLGVSIGKVLRIQSTEIRRRRRQRAQEAAMKAPIKMLFPLVFFVFPALFVILLGPALLRFLEAF